MEGRISRTAYSSKNFPTDLSMEIQRTHLFIDKTTAWLLCPLTSRLVNMINPVYQRKVVSSTVHDKYIHVMAEAECQRLYRSQKKADMVEGVVFNVKPKNTK